jgi:hypothetical protein
VEGVEWDVLGTPKRWRLWCGLVRDRGGRLRPDQDESYAFGVDVGGGLGRSNSAISVVRRSDGLKVGEFASPEYEPFDLARIIVGAALWFGGRTNPVVCWEKNGPGESLGLHLHDRLRYWPLWLREPVNDIASVPGSKLGWHSTSATKPVLLNDYAGALSRGDFVNRSVRAIEEAKGFVYARGGRITHKLRADLESGASDAHGDVTIADALAWLAVKDLVPVVKAVRRDGRRFMRTMEGMKALEKAEAMPVGRPDWRTV